LSIRNEEPRLGQVLGVADGMDSTSPFESTLMVIYLTLYLELVNRTRRPIWTDLSYAGYCVSYNRYEGTAVAQWLRCCATNRKVAVSIPAGVIGFFIDIKSLRSHYGPGVDSAPNRNEYQSIFWG